MEAKEQPMNQKDPRTLLFVPGAHPNRFDKAVAAGADLTCIDLEDAVAPKDKAAARRAAIDYLSNNEHQTVGLRINTVNSRFGVEDIQALLEHAPAVRFLLLPKTESVQTLDLVAEWIPEPVGIMPLIETARGMVNATQILAHERVRWAAFGGVDYSADVGCELSWEGLLGARTTLVAAATAGEVTLFDAPYVHIKDLTGLAEEVGRGRRIGLRAKLAIHPTQLEVIHGRLAPSEEELKKARKLVADFKAQGEGVSQQDDKMVELPLIKAAQRTLALAGESF